MLDERYVRQLALDASNNSALKRDLALHAHQRERGLWSFLTWSFFLAQVAAGSAFFGQPARAASDTDAGPNHDPSAASGATSKALGAIDDRPLSVEEAASEDARSSTPTQSGSNATNGVKASTAEATDASAEAALAARVEFGDAGATSVAALPPGDGCETPTTVCPPGSEVTDPVVPIVDILPPILGTVEDLIESLGPALDDILVPVVGTVDLLATALNPTVETLLSPVAQLTSDIGDFAAPLVDQTIAPLVDGVFKIAAPVVEPGADLAGSLLALADPLLDNVVDPLAAPVAKALDAAEPLLEPVLNAAAPLVEMVEPALQPVFEPLAPVLEPVAKLASHLPLDIGNGGLLDGILGTGGNSDAVASAGEMHFPAGSGPAGNDLYHQGTYTEYGVALQTEPTSGDASSLIDTIGDVALPISTLLGNDDDTGHGLPTNLAALHHDISLRGLSDGLM